MSHCMKITKKSYLCVKFLIDPLELSLQTQMLLYEVRESSTFLRSVGISKNQPNLESKHPNMSQDFFSSACINQIFSFSLQYSSRSCTSVIASLNSIIIASLVTLKFLNRMMNPASQKNLTDQSQFTLYISTTQKTHLSHTTTT